MPKLWLWLRWKPSLLLRTIYRKSPPGKSPIQFVRGWSTTSVIPGRTVHQFQRTSTAPSATEPISRSPQMVSFCSISDFWYQHLIVRRYLNGCTSAIKASIGKCRRLAALSVWWPDINRDIDWLEINDQAEEREPDQLIFGPAPKQLSDIRPAYPNGHSIVPTHTSCFPPPMSVQRKRSRSVVRTSGSEVEFELWLPSAKLHAMPRTTSATDCWSRCGTYRLHYF